MRRLLAARNRAVLASFTRTRLLLGFDYDGTLAPLSADPERAPMRAATAALLQRVARLYPCAVISGRGRADVARNLRAIALQAIVGNHGLEPWGVSPAIEAAARDWRRSLERALRDHEGVRVEDKRYSLAIHYRHASHPQAARAAISAAVAGLHGARISGGKAVVNVVHPEAPHKGSALEHLRRELGCEAALYVGDDDTDEDVFALDAPGLLKIRVERKAGSKAGFYLRDQAEIDLLLQALIDQRADG